MATLRKTKSSPFKLYDFLNRILSQKYIFQSILYYPTRGPKITLVNPPLNKGHQPSTTAYETLLFTTVHCCVPLRHSMYYSMLLCAAAYCYCVRLCATVSYWVLCLFLLSIVPPLNKGWGRGGLHNKVFNWNRLINHTLRIGGGYLLTRGRG